MNEKYDIDLMNDSISLLDDTFNLINKINKNIEDINKVLNEEINYNIDKINIDTKSIEKKINIEKKQLLIKMICTCNFDIIYLLNNNIISISDLIEIAEIYIKIMVKNKNYVPYYRNLIEINDPFNTLLKDKLSYEVANTINDSIINYLINNNLIYNVDGFDFAYTFIGLFTMFGYKISNKILKENTGFYLGDENNRLSGINDLYNFFCKSIGFNSYGYDLQNKYKLSGYDGINSLYVNGYTKMKTDINEINAPYKSKYFTIGKKGDILINKDNLLLILDNDNEGYYVVESNDITKGLVISYYNYDALREYTITNMVSFYENVTKNYNNTNARNSNFISCIEFVTSLNINNYNKEKLLKAYNTYNKNPNDFDNPYIDEKKMIEKYGDITKIRFNELENTLKLVPILGKNILPENKFSDALPPISYGNINYMEINETSVNYEIININDEIFKHYINMLRSFGYRYLSNNIWMFNNYKLTIGLSDDNNKMVLSLVTVK